MKCCPPLYKDIAHTAYIRHFNKHGTNLFDQPIYTILRYVRNVWFNEIQKGRYMKDGTYYTRQYCTPTEEWTEDPDSVILRSTAIPADKQLMIKEFYEELFKRIDAPKVSRTFNGGYTTGVDPTVLRRFLELLDAGYKSAEICEEMGISPQTLYYYKNKLKKIIKDMDKEGMKSPFNADKILIKAKVTRKVYEAHPEKYGEFVYDPERDCDFNEAYMTTINPQGEFLLIREKGD